jgi:hypothetical protein
METVLFFISSTRHTCTNRLEGICHYAHTQGWYVQVVERAFRKVDVARQLEFWRAILILYRQLLGFCGYSYRRNIASSLFIAENFELLRGLALFSMEK